MFTLEDKTALVCGASRGIGRACAEEFARLGATCILVSRSGETLRVVERGLARDLGQEHASVVADFHQPQVLEEKIGEVLNKIGSVQILLNNTGGPKGGPMLEATPEELVRAFSQHLVCNQVVARLVVPGMKQSKYGRIINIISTSVKQPISNLGVSNTIRGAVASWAKTLAEELGPFEITVNNILPGYIETDRLREIIDARARISGIETSEVRSEMIAQVPAGRFGAAAEIAMVAGFLASPQASYVNGVSLPVDGGRTRSF